MNSIPALFSMAGQVGVVTGAGKGDRLAQFTQAD